jgi:hypothetical protein
MGLDYHATKTAVRVISDRGYGKTVDWMEKVSQPD